MDPKSRADYGKAHVIISEKKDKKAAKYMVKDLPYPYTSKAQFERSIETPLGPEWNTRVGFQRGTLPKVTKKVRQISVSYALNIGSRSAFIDGYGHQPAGEVVLSFQPVTRLAHTQFFSICHFPSHTFRITHFAVAFRNLDPCTSTRSDQEDPPLDPASETKSGLRWSQKAKSSKKTINEALMYTASRD